MRLTSTPAAAAPRGAVYHLYLDDSGSRNPDHLPKKRRDGMDYFALGGILVAAKDIDAICQAYKEFRTNWKIDYPLHSSNIRGKRSTFAWLAVDEACNQAFLGGLQTFVLGLPTVALAAVVHRPGYVARYAERYKEDTWLMCKTAFSIIVERAAKFVRTRDAQLEIFFEQSGKHEDRLIKKYGRSLTQIEH
jgi:hypothetical protein